VGPSALLQTIDQIIALILGGPDGGAGKEVVLVGGWDWEAKTDQGGIKFAELARARMRQLFGRGLGMAAFTIFDVRAGKVTSTRLEDGKEQTTELYEGFFKPMTVRIYRGQETNKDVLSITDVYAHLRKVGQEKPGTVIHLSFLGHGWQEGPVLVNTYEDDPSYARRDPDDKDGRSWKDFISPNMSASFRDDLRSAFAEGATGWQWGCAWWQPYYALANGIRRSDGYKPAGGTDTDTQLDFIVRKADPATWGDQAAELAKPPFDVLFGEPNSAGEYNIQASFGELVSFFRDINFTQAVSHPKDHRKVYARYAANALGIPFYSAAPGTYADFESNLVPAPKPALMRIPQGETGFNKVNLRPVIDFYKAYLGFDTDIEGRGYLRYLPET
jgi:hypothetical protein